MAIKRSARVVRERRKKREKTRLPARVPRTSRESLERVRQENRPIQARGTLIPCLVNYPPNNRLEAKDMLREASQAVSVGLVGPLSLCWSTPNAAR